MRIALLALAGAVFAGNAFAATTVTNSFQVKATVVPACVVSQATVMNFGNYDPLSATAATTTSTVGVRCTKGTNYSVALNEGVNFSAAGCDTPLRRMTDGTNFLTYAITSTSGGSAWGCNAASQFVAAAASNAEKTFTAYGVIPAGQDVPAGSFVDTVTVSVTF